MHLHLEQLEIVKFVSTFYFDCSARYEAGITSEKVSPSPRDLDKVALTMLKQRSDTCESLYHKLLSSLANYQKLCMGIAVCDLRLNCFRPVQLGASFFGYGGQGALRWVWMVVSTVSVSPILIF